MMLRSLVFALVVGMFSQGASFGQTPAPAAPPQTPEAQKPATPPSAPVPDLPDAPGVTPQAMPPVEPTGPTVILDTTMGRLTCRLYDKQAPIASANFIGLATGSKTWTDPETQKKVTGKPFYDGTTFHRVIPGFMIQGGDRLGTGMGDAGYYFQNEVDPSLTFNVPGRLAMANAGPGPTGSGTNGSQFFITEVPVPQLDGGYTIFGQCDPHTVAVVASIARVQRDENDKPLTPVVINHVTVVREGQPIPPDPMAPPANAATGQPAGAAATTAPVQPQ